MKLSAVSIICIVLVFATGALAQGDTSLSAQPGNRPGVSAAIGMASPGLGSGGYVPGAKGRPYSAETINETDHTLSDGNHFYSKMHSKIFRDAEGRTRQEMEVKSRDGSRRVLITIQDPIAKIYVQLEPENKTATLYSYGPLGIGTPVFPATSAEKTRPQATAALSAPPKQPRVRVRFLVWVRAFLGR